MSYNHSFVPEEGYFFYPTPENSSVVLSVLRPKSNIKHGLRKTTQKANVIINDPRTLQFKKHGVSTFNITGKVDNKRKGERKRCGISHAEISAVQMSISCLPYLD